MSAGKGASAACARTVGGCAQHARGRMAAVTTGNGAPREEEGSGGESAAPQPQAPPNASGARLSRLPLARVKALVKADPDVTLAGQEAIFILARAAVGGALAEEGLWAGPLMEAGLWAGPRAGAGSWCLGVPEGCQGREAERERGREGER